MKLQAAIDLYANRKLHYRMQHQGLPISVENRKGSVRKGCDKKWGCWRTKMTFPYGYIRGTKGMDGDEVDVFVGPKVDAKFAYIIMIKKQPDFKKNDEEKVMLGFESAKEAKEAFMENYSDPRFFGRMKKVPMPVFSEKVMQKPGQVAAWGEPQIYDGGYQHIAESQVPYRAPSNKKGKRVPTDDPRETDDKYLDVTKRKDKETIGFRNRLTKQHTDQNMRALNTQLVGGFPSGTVGGFG